MRLPEDACIKKLLKLLHESPSSHDLDHVMRVFRLAVDIGEKEGADLRVIQVAALLHDIARLNNIRKRLGGIEYNHAIAGAKKARQILSDIGLNESFIARVEHCIESHSYSSPIVPLTLEAKVLSDADKLDAMGAVGIGRAFMYAGENGKNFPAVIQHFEEKLLRLYDLLNTPYARKIGKKRHRVLKEFLEQLKKELDWVEEPE
jgi:uncharacterized protein